MLLTDNLGGNLRRWSLDKERYLAVNNGSMLFEENLERELWGRLINKVEQPELFEYFAKSAKGMYYPYSPRVYFGGHEFKSTENIHKEIEIRKKICDLLAKESQKALTKATVPASPAREKAGH